MKHKTTLLSLIIGGILSLSVDALAQGSFSTSAFLDINRIKANHLVHGDLWWNPPTYEPSCEFPKGSGKHINTTGAIWLSGYDDQSQLHISGQTVRVNGNDFWPGPIENTIPLSYNTAQKWARIWKISLTDLEDFVDLPTHTQANTLPDILEWPAKGNPYARGNNNEPLQITRDMAPFVDVDGDGNYNALKGDYPLIKGNQMLWWVMNDFGPSHGATQGMSLQMEIKVMAYAYTGDQVNHALFYEYELTNRSPFTYNNFRFGLFNEADLGHPNDDYLGFDSSRRMAILYNGKQEDGWGESYAYGYHVPMSAITFLETPGDFNTNYESMGSFVAEKQMQAFNSTTAFNNMMRSMSSDGHPITVSCGPDSGQVRPYAFNGNLNDSLGWTECNCNEQPWNQRFVLATNDYHFAAGAKAKYAFALLVTDTLSNMSCGGSFKDLQNLADYASKGYHLDHTTAVNELAKSSVSLKIYPNPASQQLFVENDRQDLHNASVVIYDGLGRTLHLPINLQGNKMEVDIHSLPNGVYTLLYSNGGKTSSNVFIVKN